MQVELRLLEVWTLWAGAGQSQASLQMGKGGSRDDQRTRTGGLPAQVQGGADQPGNVGSLLRRRQRKRRERGTHLGVSLARPSQTSNYRPVG